jgi:hypothetical protein
MVHRILCATLVMALLTGCATPAPPRPQTPGQAWYAATAAYTVAVESARAYRRECLTKPRILQTDCRAAVLAMAKIDRDAMEIQEYGDLAVADGDADLLEEAIEALDRIKRRLQNHLAQQMEKEGRP